MDGLMMDFPLTLTHLLRRAESFFGDGEIVTRLPDKSFHRTNHRDTLRRSRQLAVALQKIGLERGDRVATLCWNHYQHHEAYFGVPCGGFVLHTLNLRLHPNDLNYIATHAGDRAVIVDRALLPLLEQFREGTPIEHVFVVEDSYEELLATADPDEWKDPELDENEAAAMCYTSGTTGRPRGVVYSHRSSVLHALGVGANNPLGLGFGIDDAVMPVVPMFHANAWGYPYLATMQGAKLVYPGPHLDPDSLLENMEQEKVTWAAGVPTIWMGILARLDAEPGRWDLSAMKAMLVGGSAVPRAMIAAFEGRHGLKICQGWGMTETSPVASTVALPYDLAEADDETRWDFQAMVGFPLPFVEIRVRAGDEEVPWDGEAMGELEVRGPWVAACVLRRAGDDRPLDGGRLVPHRRHRLDPSARLHPDQGPLEGRDQVGRRMDLVGRARERAHGTLRGRRGGGDRGARRQVGRAAARGGRAARGRLRDGRRAAGVPRAELREVVGARADRVRGRDPEDERRQVPQDGAARAVRGRDRADKLKAAVLPAVDAPFELREVDDPVPAGRRGARARAGGRDQLPRHPDPARPLSADARVPCRARGGS